MARQRTKVTEFVEFSVLHNSTNEWSRSMIETGLKRKLNADIGQVTRNSLIYE